MRILVWHGYLLGGTGSNVYTRALAREWSRARARRDGRLPGAALGAATTSARRARRRARAPGARCCRCSCSTSYDGPRVRSCFRTSRPRSATRTSTRTPPRCDALLPADLVFANHVLAGRRRSAPRLRRRFVVKAHGSELEYSMRGNERARRACARRRRSHDAEAVYVGSEHIRARARRGRRATSTACTRFRRASTSTSSFPRLATQALAALIAEARARRPGATATSACPIAATPSGSRRSSRATQPTVLYFGKLIENKGVQLLLDGARRARRARA